MPSGVYPHKPVDERFWSYVIKDGPIPEHNPSLGSCWLWIGGLTRGYGRFWNGNTQVYAHHYLTGKPPQGMQTDHLCRNPQCMRPTHLEFVTPKVNVQRMFQAKPRKTHCMRGHPLEGANRRISTKGHTICRECVRIRQG